MPNLARDVYIRRLMDAEGFVPLEQVAAFNRVKNLTDDVNVVLEAIQDTPDLEVVDHKIRRRNDWQRFLLPSVQGGSPSIPALEEPTDSPKMVRIA